MNWKPSDARTALAALVASADPDIRVIGYADDVAPEPKHPVAVVFVETVGPAEVQVAAALLWRMSVIVAVAKTEPGVADADLDDALGAILAALDADPLFIWSEATRSIYLDGAFPAYVITVEVRQ